MYYLDCILFLLLYVVHTLCSAMYSFCINIYQFCRIWEKNCTAIEPTMAQSYISSWKQVLRGCMHFYRKWFNKVTWKFRFISTSVGLVVCLGRVHSCLWQAGQRTSDRGAFCSRPHLLIIWHYRIVSNHNIMVSWLSYRIEFW